MNRIARERAEKALVTVFVLGLFGAFFYIVWTLMTIVRP